MPREPGHDADRTREASAEQATRARAHRIGAAAGTVPWQPIRLEETDSTNRYLADLARAGAPHGTVVLAERQSAGRGRLGRRWLDVPGGSLSCSVLLRWELGLDQWYLGGWLVALAGADAALELAGVEARCKWPNDLEVSGRKVGGVLAEVVEPPPPPGVPAQVVEPPPPPGVPAEAVEPPPTPGGRLPGGSSPRGALVVGIGINCNWPQDWPPAEDAEAVAVAARATSLDREAGRPVERDAVAGRLVEGIARRAASPEPRRLGAEYRRRCSTIGADVRVDLGEEQFSGRALDVDEAGHLLVDVGSCIRIVAAGDVVHLRTFGDPARGSG